MTNRSAVAGFLLAVAAITPLAAQTRYQTPSAEIIKILEAPSAPVASVSPNREWILVTRSDPRTITIRDMAEPAYYLAGSKISVNPDFKVANVGISMGTISSIDGKATFTLPVPAGGRIGAAEWSRSGNSIAFTTIGQAGMRLHVMALPSGTVHEITGPGLTGRLQNLAWSAQDKYLAFTSATPEGVALWVAQPAGAARRITAPVLNAPTSGSGRGEIPPCSWVDARNELLCRLIPAGRGAPPKHSDVPSGPIVQESYGQTAPARTYEYLLSSPEDETLFEYYYTNQVALVTPSGKITRLGNSGVQTAASASPDGNYFLVETAQRPYSYQVPLSSFASRTEVWNARGAVLREIQNTRVAMDAPAMRDATVPGIRDASWRPDAPATVVLVEALDQGDPRTKVAKRDRVSLLDAPFSGQPARLFETEFRYGGITWVDSNIAFLTERLSRGARTRTWLIDPSQPGEAPKLLWARNSEDRYGDPGSWVMVKARSGNRQMPLRSSDGRYLYLSGNGASSAGERPFLDRFELATRTTSRLWQSAAPYYESVLAVVDADARRVITRKESPAEAPNYFVRDLGSQEVKQLTHLGDPAPYFAGVKSELLTYARADGVKLSATMYLPPGYDKSKGTIPFLFWAYPREFQSDSAASQLTGSPYQFRRPSRSNYMMMLLYGYGVLDNPVMPIVGRNGKEPNDTYVEQLVASAQAASNKLVSLGVADPGRLAIGGHSYGAFMTVNLLAHSDIFRTGIAESGAYNRTLTPFGFQAEPRNYWEAQSVYAAMSPFNYADKINEPVLLIHGQRDDNSGTFPINSERLFSAIKGLGGSVRYVQLPLEPHGYTAVETNRHLLWEYVTWLDKYVKNAPRQNKSSE